MRIYKAEREDGLTDRLSKPGNIAFASQAKFTAVIQPPSEKLKKLAASKSVASITDADLYPLNSILANTGWNKNYAVFETAELWNARHTPEDKPFNYEHNNSDIIGHMTGSKVLGLDGVEVADDTADDEVPEGIEIHTSAVLYRKWDDETLQERMDKVIAEIGEGKWFVSMECLFPDFDYALRDKDGNQKIVARNGKTAFLTKKCKFYGGDGVYDGCDLGMVLRNFFFSGKGLTQNPANPPSVIYEFNTAKAKFYTSMTDAGYQQLSGTVIDTIGNQKMEKELADAKTALTAATEAQKVAEAKAAAAEKATADAIADAAEKAKVAAEAAKVELAKATETIKTLEADKVTASKTADYVGKALAETKTKLLEATRVETAVSKGLTKEDATKIVANSLSLTDEQFAASIEVTGLLAAKAAKKSLPETETNTPAVELPAKTEAAAIAAVTPNTATETGPTAGKSLAARIRKTTGIKSGSQE